MRARLKTGLWLVLRLGVSAGLLWHLLSRPHLLEAFRRCDQHLAWVYAGVASVAACALLSAWRWYLLARTDLPKFSYAFALRNTLIASFFTIASLGTLGGDAWRVIAVRQRFPGRGIEAGVVIMLDHIAGLAGSLAYFSIAGTLALFAWPQRSAEVQSIVMQFALIMLGAVVLITLAMISLTPAFVRRFERFIPTAVLPRVQRASQHFGAFSGRGKVLASAAAVSLPLICVYFFTFYCGLRAIGGSSEPLPVMLAMPIVDAAASLPISVSGLGVREGIFEFLMHRLIGMPAEQSVPAALAGWLFTLMGALVGGCLFLVLKEAPHARSDHS
jgi:glycosyltransferase 2 family protein